MSNKQIILFLLISTSISTAFLLPKLIEEPLYTIKETSIENSPQIPQLTPSQLAEKQKYRLISQELLAQIITRKDSLDLRGVRKWGQFEFLESLKLIKIGDQLYLDTKYQQAIAHYNTALDILRGLETTAEATLEASIKSGLKNILQGEVYEAQEHAQTAITIAPENPQAALLLRRIESLPMVLVHFREATAHQDAGELDLAKRKYQLALALDDNFSPAKAALKKVNKTLRDRDFQSLMSLGWDKLEKNQFQGARNAFASAKTLDKSKISVDKALLQLETRKQQFEVTKKMELASKLELDEKWGQALQVYNDLIQLDGTLVQPRVKKINASIRSDLDRQTKAILAAPLALSDKKTYIEAKVLLDNLLGIASNDVDTLKLSGQIRDLEKLLKRSQIATEVILQSDGQTEVTLLRVSKLGVFARKTVSLRPGKYSILGARTGFRDVLIEFTVDIGSNNMPIDVRCSEAI
ncbi:MAG: hypothetical protein CBC09_06305 [Cellvibrionales bacterium TMED49]|nr:hypothetical protein [Porticoccaceae bacterium]OUU37872.1 MAG: hypothetical protein CBC09_06305 [Cellvibrionales bacterium TMED49]